MVDSILQNIKVKRRLQLNLSPPMISLLKLILALTGIISVFYLLLKGALKRDQQQFKKAFFVLIIIATLLISITAIEFAVKLI
jgi:uncharacterized membrane protein